MIKKQRGVTLIELMISMVLGLGLIAGIGQLFVQSQKSFKLQRNVSDMTDDGAFLLEVLAKGILLAGFLDDPTKNDLSTTPFQPDSTPLSSAISFDTHEYVHGTDNELIYRYESSDASQLSNFLCTDTFTAFHRNDVVTVRLYKTNDSNNIPVIYCQAKQVGTAGTESKAAAPLISEIEQLVFKYGVRDKNGTSTDATDDKFYYTTAAAVTTANAWANIFSIKIFVVLRSVEDNLVRNQTGYKIDGVQQTPVPTDHRIYKVFSKTIFLRGLIQ